MKQVVRSHPGMTGRSTWVNRVMLLHPPTPRPSQGWGATKVDSGPVLHSPSTGIMEGRLRHSPLHPWVKLHQVYSQPDYFHFECITRLDLERFRAYIKLTWWLFMPAGAMKSPVSSAAGMPPPPVSSQYNPSVQQNGAHMYVQLFHKTHMCILRK